MIALSIPEGTPRPTFSESKEGRGVIALSRASHPGEDRAEGDVIASRPEPFDCAQDRLAEGRRGNRMLQKVRLPPLDCPRGRLCPSLRLGAPRNDSLDHRALPTFAGENKRL